MVFVRKGKAYNMQFYYYICEILKLSVQDAILALPHKLLTLLTLVTLLTWLYTANHK